MSDFKGEFNFLVTKLHNSLKKPGVIHGPDATSYFHGSHSWDQKTLARTPRTSAAVGKAVGVIHVMFSFL